MDPLHYNRVAALEALDRIRDALEECAACERRSIPTAAHASAITAEQILERAQVHILALQDKYKELIG